MIKELKHTKRLGLMVALLLVLSLYYAINKPSSELEAAEPPKKGRSNAVLVTTEKASISNQPLSLSAIGNMEALETVSIQPQISGQLLKVHFAQGDFVRKGQLLFELDPRLQQAALNQQRSELARSQSAISQARANLARSNTQISVAEANIRRDRAQQKFAQAQVERYREGAEKQLVSREQFEQFNAQLGAADAALAADQAALLNARAQVQADQAALQTAQAAYQAEQANLATAKIQQGFTRIYSPISGKTGPLLINAGNNVQANSSNLVNIKRLSPIQVSFSIPEKDLFKVQSAMAKGPVLVNATPQAAASTEAPVTGPSYSGRLIFVDNSINKNTGTVQLRASFDNLGGKLWPGQFVRLSIQLGLETNVISIAAEAVQRGQEGDYVYLLKDKKAVMQKVVVERIANNRAILSKGLQAQQEVIVKGQQALAPGVAVRLSEGKGAKAAADKPQNAKAGGQRAKQEGQAE